MKTHTIHNLNEAWKTLCAASPLLFVLFLVLFVVKN